MAGRKKPADLPRKLGGLKPAPWNPRQIGPDEAAALKKSLAEFGDIGGIVYHEDGYLIAGHQRVAALRLLYGDDLPIRTGAIVTPAGERFPVRIVDWPEEKAKAANLAANSPLVAGEFTAGARDVAGEVAAWRLDLADALRFSELEFEPGAAEEWRAEETEGEPGPPAMELQPFEHYDYLLVLATTTQDWEWLCERLGIEKVDSCPLETKKRIGLGRAINARRLIEVLKKPAGKKA